MHGPLIKILGAGPPASPGSTPLAVTDNNVVRQPFAAKCCYGWAMHRLLTRPG